MKTIVLLLAIIFPFIGYANADVLKDKDEAKKIAKSAMEYVGKGDVEKGLLLIKPYLIIPEHEFEGVLSSLKMQAPAIEQRYGKTIDIEFMDVEEVGESLMLVMYIQKFERHLMRWKFYFYKPADGWVLNTFSTDDQIQMMFNNI